MCQGLSTTHMYNRAAQDFLGGGGGTGEDTGNLVVESWSSMGCCLYLPARAAAGIKVGPVKEVWGIWGLRLLLTSSVKGRPQSWPGQVYHGELLLSLLKPQGQLAWLGEYGSIKAGILVASRFCVLWELGSNSLMRAQ